MTNTIDLNIMMPPLHHTMFISDIFVLLSQVRVKAVCDYSPLQG